MTDSYPAWYALPSCSRQVGGLGGILLKLDNYLEYPMHISMSTTSPWRMGVVAGIFCLLQATPLLASENTVATINGADTAWMIVATALVLFMTLPGLALFYGGLVRSKNVLSVLVQCFAHRYEPGVASSASHQLP